MAFFGRETPALDRVSFSIERGELTGVTGPSGPASRRCSACWPRRLVRRARRCGSTAWRRAVWTAPAIRWLGQRTYLFPGTIADNITLSRTGHDDVELLRAARNAGLDKPLDRLPDGLATPVRGDGWGFSGGESRDNLLLADPTADERELWDALAASAIGETVSGLGGGLHTPVGPGGAALSGGQRRRLSVAQGVLRRPGVPAARRANGRPRHPDRRPAPRQRPNRPSRCGARDRPTRPPVARTPMDPDATGPAGSDLRMSHDQWTGTTPVMGWARKSPFPGDDGSPLGRGDLPGPGSHGLESPCRVER